MATEFDYFVDAAVTEAKRSSAKMTANRDLARIDTVTEGADVDFCKLWPTIKAGLDLLKNLLPAWARWAVELVIKLGDRYCGS